MKALYSITIIYVLCCGVNHAAATWRIINGTRANLGQFPWMAKIRSCSASILDAETVLTAGHCVCRRAPSRVKVGSVVAANRSEGTWHAVKRTIVQPRYACPTISKNDIAILKLKEPITFSDTVKPIGLLCDGGYPVEGTRAVSMGYGTDETGKNGVLKFGHTAVLARPLCENSLICSLRRPNGLYFGDSGGPLVVQTADGGFQQLGVNSGMSPDVSKYANVPQYCKWIKMQMKKH